MGETKKNIKSQKYHKQLETMPRKEKKSRPMVGMICGKDRF